MIKPNWIALLRLNSITSWIALEVWLFCEYFHIPLGRFGPFVFGVMMGQKGKRKEQSK